MQFDYTLKRRDVLGSGSVSLGTLPVVSSGSSADIQSESIDTSASAYKVVNNEDYMYWVEVGITRLTNIGPNLRFYGMSIQYTTAGPGH
ncbi:MAG TPA: hypothetical protein VMO47_04105 [Rhodothermales bacterium]|nr:hypothetical protein [Rhodothermales bacterium]